MNLLTPLLLDSRNISIHSKRFNKNIISSKYLFRFNNRNFHNFVQLCTPFFKMLLIKNVTWITIWISSEI